VFMEYATISVFSAFETKSVAACLYRHGPAPARHGTQRYRSRRLAEAL